LSFCQLLRCVRSPTVREGNVALAYARASVTTYKSPALANNAGLSSNCFEQRLKVAELFSRLFFVAASRLNSPRFSAWPIETSLFYGVKQAICELVTYFDACLHPRIHTNLFLVPTSCYFVDRFC